MHLDFEKSWAFNADSQYQNTQQVVSEFAMQLTVLTIAVFRFLLGGLRPHPP